MFAVNIEDNDQLADEITTLAGQINAANYRFLKLISEFDRRGAWVDSGIRSCAYWLNWKCGIAMNAAREKVRVARALDGLPEINEDFEKGELSFSKVRAMTRIATPLNESYLLMIANHGTAQHVELLVRAYRFVSPRCDAEKPLLMALLMRRGSIIKRVNTSKISARFLVIKMMMACGIFKRHCQRRKVVC